MAMLGRFLFETHDAVRLRKQHYDTSDLEILSDIPYMDDGDAGHLFDKNVKVAAGVAMNIGIPFAELEKVKLNFNIGVRDKFFLKNEGLENRASVIMAIGVENVIR